MLMSSLQHYIYLSQSPEVTRWFARCVVHLERSAALRSTLRQTDQHRSISHSSSREPSVVRLQEPKKLVKKSYPSEVAHQNKWLNIQRKSHHESFLCSKEPALACRLKPMHRLGSWCPARAEPLQPNKTTLLNAPWKLLLIRDMVDMHKNVALGWSICHAWPDVSCRGFMKQEEQPYNESQQISNRLSQCFFKAVPRIQHLGRNAGLWIISFFELR